MDDEEETFYVQFVSVLLLIASLAGLCVFSFLWLTEGDDIDVTAAAIAGMALVAFGSMWARRLIDAYPIHVRPTGLRAYGLRGGPATDAHWFEWSTITHVSRFHVPFIPCLVLHTGRDKRRYLVPVKLVQMERFRELVNQYAGAAHPLRCALQK